MLKNVIIVGQMTERNRQSTDTWIIPKDPVKKGPRPVFGEDTSATYGEFNLSRSRLLARRRRHQRGFGLTARYSTSRQH